MTLTLVLLTLLMLLTGCDSGDDPAVVIERYLQARVTSDVDQLRALACADWEAQTLLEANSFRGRDARLEGLACRVESAAGDARIVGCAGVIIASYQGEESEFPLKSYRVIREDGAWKMCGEAG